MPRSITCPRCGYSTERLCNYKSHIRRIKRCNAKVLDVIPTLDNCTHDANDTTVIAASVINTVNNNNNTVNNNPVNNNSVNNNTVNNNNITINIHAAGTTVINELGQENKSYINDADMLELLRMCAQGGPAALLELIRMVHYNKDHPENMNVVFPHPPFDDGKILAYTRTSRSQKAPEWHLLHKDVPIGWLINERVSQMSEYAFDNQASLDPDLVHKVDSYHDAVQGSNTNIVATVERLCDVSSHVVMLLNKQLMEPLVAMRQ